MPKFKADWMQELSLKQLLDARGQTHTRVRAHGDLLIVESGPKDDAVPHVRFRRQGVHIWTLELPSQTERWNKTPYRGPMEAMLDVLEHEIPWVLAPIHDDPQATSGTPY